MAFTSWMICPKGFPSPLISIHAPRTGSDNCRRAGETAESRKQKQRRVFWRIPKTKAESAQSHSLPSFLYGTASTF